MKIYKLRRDSRIEARQIEGQEDVYEIFYKEEKILLTFDTQIENRPEVWQLVEDKLDLRSPEAEKMREEARSKRWEHIPKEGDNLYIHTFKENVDKIYYSQAISRNEILAQWNIGNYHKSYEDMEAWGDKYARYFFTE